jgi:divalent metal cation (Fe/Co/Zn/Cd) transporter
MGTLFLVCGYILVEAIGGWAAGSLALLADAGHMLSDAASLGLTLFAVRIAKRPPDHQHTYGFRRAEVLAATAEVTVVVVVMAEVVDSGSGKEKGPLYHMKHYWAQSYVRCGCGCGYDDFGLRLLGLNVHHCFDRRRSRSSML